MFDHRNPLAIIPYGHGAGLRVYGDLDPIHRRIPDFIVGSVYKNFIEELEQPGYVVDRPKLNFARLDIKDQQLSLSRLH